MKTEKVMEKLEELESTSELDSRNDKVWFKTEDVHEVIKELKKLSNVHLATITGKDLGEEIELIYHFSVFFGRKDQETLVNASLKISKEKNSAPSICDEIPGALLAEKEMQEMLGIEFEGIPDDRNAFLPKDHPPVKRKEAKDD